MSDRKMLEFAAKAAAIDVFWWPADDPVVLRLKRNNDLWNPLTDDGDALRLAVKLRLMDEVSVMNSQYESVNPLVATRRAIVRAAAEIGRQMP